MVAKFRFVGFQDHYEVPDPKDLVELQVDIECSVDEVKAFSLIGEVRYLNLWFYEIQEFDSKPGGKIRFIDSKGKVANAICISYRPGKEVSILADECGELVAQIHRNDEKVSIRIQLKSVDEDRGSKEALFNSFVTRLRELTW